MQVIIKEKNKVRLNRFLDWLLYMIGYTIVFILVTSLFQSIYVEESHAVIWSTITVVILYILNKTIKPILVTLTIPITGITLGLFYPCINVFILKLVDWILGPYFEVTNLWSALVVGILLSIINFIMEKIIDHIIKKVKKNG